MFYMIVNISKGKSWYVHRCSSQVFPEGLKYFSLSAERITHHFFLGGTKDKTENLNSLQDSKEKKMRIAKERSDSHLRQTLYQLKGNLMGSIKNNRYHLPESVQMSRSNITSFLVILAMSIYLSKDRGLNGRITFSNIHYAIFHH